MAKAVSAYAKGTSMSKILAIDPGTVTGWAFSDGQFSVSGTWNFKPRRGDGAGMRFLRLRSKLDEVYGLRGGLDRLIYELPAGQYKSGAADDVIKGMVSHIQSWAESVDVPYEGVAPAELKKFAVGKGKANKDLVLAAAKARWPEITDHNAADAMFILHMVLEGELA